MILNGLSVAASLLRRGEDSLLNQNVLASAFQLNKRDLIAAREKTGCYSLTRYHLNEAADLLGLKPTEFVYKVTPNMLKTEGTGSATVSGAEAEAVGATGLDAGTTYRADVNAKTDAEAMLLDLAGAAKGGDFAPEEITNRFKVLNDIADAQSGSMVAALLSTLGETTLLRYNASAINKLVFESMGDADGTLPETRQAAATLHLSLATFGAYSTGAVLSMLRQFLSTGIIFNYDEGVSFRNWMYQFAAAFLGFSVRVPVGNERPNAKLDKVFDAAYEGTKTWHSSPYFSSIKGDMGWGGSGRFVSSALQNEMKKYIDGYGGYYKGHHLGNGLQLDVDGLVARTNKLLRATPQLLSR